MGGGIEPAKSIVDRLFARGFVLLGAGEPIVFLSIEWCEIRNDAFARWRDALALAAGTDPRRVMVSCIHVHDAPIADLTAERILRAHGAAGSVCDLDFHEQAVQRVAASLRSAVREAAPVTHVGHGRASVENIASNRRYSLPDGRPAYDRMSANRNVIARDAETGTIDPWLRTLSFWNGDHAVVALHNYATHPMSYYGRGAISADFPGIARASLQAASPRTHHIYSSGCSGNVTAGKWNDGAPENRARLAARLTTAMETAWRSTERSPIDTVAFRRAPLRLEPRNVDGFSSEELWKRLRTDPKPFGQCLAALGLSWRYHAGLDNMIDVPLLDLGLAQLLLLPAESYVEFQLHAQQVRPGSFVMTCGYGECAPGYIPIERAWDERDSNLHDWCWVARGSEARMKKAIESLLAPPATAAGQVKASGRGSGPSQPC